MQGLLEWLTSLPPAPLYLFVGCFAAFENFFPPVPADTIVALGSFLAARGRGSLGPVIAVTLAGNVAGAAVTYWAGRVFGARQVEIRLLGAKGIEAEMKLRSLYGRYGLAAIFISRFIPGVRAIVPPFAGALRVPPIRAFSVIAVASFIWYGSLAYLAFRLGGADWSSVVDAVENYLTGAAAVGGLMALLLVLLWLRHRRKIRG